MGPTKKKDYLHVLLDLSVVFLIPWGNGSRFMQVVFLWCVQGATGSGMVTSWRLEQGWVSTIEETPSAVMWFTA